MHCAQQSLLNLGKLDVGFVAAFTFHASRDTAYDNYCVGILDSIGYIVKFNQLTLADVAAQHCEVGLAMLVFDDYIVGFAFLYGE